MRTLKKTLCLVLCLAMMVGLCAFGAGAAFTDVAEIENKEAVDLLVGIGVIKGYEDGSFKPEGTLTRAEAAVILTRLLGNGDLPEAKTPFTDMAGYGWASGAIAYCANAGIIAGYGNGKFGPGDTLTAAQWGKMLLCALGYNAEAEGLVGNGWDLNVTRLVKKTGLADAADFGSGAAAATRDFACAMAFNALTVPMVQYEGALKVETSDGTTVTANATLEPANSYLCDNFGLKAGAAGENWQQKDGFAANTTVKGVITDNSYNAIDGTKTKLGGVKDALTVETGEELLGRFVIAYKDTKGKVLSVTEIGSVTEVAKTADNAKAAFGADVENAATVYKFDAGKNTDSAAYKIANDAKVPAGTYVFNDEGKLVAEIYDYEIVTLEKFAKFDEKAKTNNYQFASGLQFDTAAIRTELTLAKDDVVIVRQVGALYYVEAIEPVEGAISKVDKDGNITLDGTAYGPFDSDYKTTAVAAEDIADLQSGKVALKGTVFQVYLYNDEYIAVAVKSATKAPFEPYFVATEEVAEKAILNGDEVVSKFYATVVDQEGNVTTVQVMNKDAAKGLAGEIVLVEDVPNQEYKKLNKITGEDVKEDYGVTLDKATKLQTDAKTTSYAFETLKAVRVNANTKFIFVSQNPTTKAFAAEVKSGLFDMKEALAANVITKADADENVVAQIVYVIGGFSAKITVNPSTTVYVAPNTVKSETTADGYIYTVYDMTGAAKQITMNSANALKDKTGFYTFTTDEKTGITTVSDYTIDKDANGKVIKDLEKSFVLDESADGKFENNIKMVKSGEVNAANAIFVDLRTPAKVTDIATLVADQKNVVFDVLFDKGAASIIFVRAIPAE